MILLVCCIGLLLALILWLRLSAFLSLIITALCAGLASGMEPASLIKTMQNGMGSTLGELVMVLALGITLGSILTETGAAKVISARLLRLFGPKRASWAVVITGFVVGIAMFYNAGFVVLAPLVFTIAAASNQRLLPLAISMAAPLSVTHGFLPPHPGAALIAKAFGADLGKTLLLGLIVAVPAILVAGIFLPKYGLKNIEAKPPEGLFLPAHSSERTPPGFLLSLSIALLPLLLMATSTIAVLTYPNNDQRLYWVKFWGDSGVAMLLTVLVALLLFGRNQFFNRNKDLSAVELLEKSTTALGSAVALLLVIAAGGAFKQVLIDSGLGKNLAEQLSTLHTSPLLLGWGIATLLRIAMGSATTAGITAAGLVQPLMVSTGTSPELMTLAVGAGSLMCSHVNDTGFWMFKEWFGLSLRDTFRSWTVMETIVGLMGLMGVLLLDAIL